MYKELTIENIKTFEKEQKLKLKPITLLYGENSSGKTTLLNMLAGLDSPSSGTVSVNGINLSDMNDFELTRLRRNTVGFVFQSFGLLP